MPLGQAAMTKQYRASSEMFCKVLLFHKRKWAGIFCPYWYSAGKGKEESAIAPNRTAKNFCFLTIYGTIACSSRHRRQKLDDRWFDCGGERSLPGLLRPFRSFFPVGKAVDRSVKSVRVKHLHPPPTH